MKKLIHGNLGSFGETNLLAKVFKLPDSKYFYNEGLEII